MLLQSNLIEIWIDPENDHIETSTQFPATTVNLQYQNRVDLLRTETFIHSFSFKTTVLLLILLVCNTVQTCFAQDSRTLSASLPPSQNFDLSYWNLSVPTDADNNGRSDTINEAKLNQGYQNPDYFYTAPDGGMVFKVPVKGFKTSKNTSYTRTELREMLRRGDTSIDTRNGSGLPNKNNWVFSSAPKEAQKLAGAVDGVLEATVAVNHVTTTGPDWGPQKQNLSQKWIRVRREVLLQNRRQR